MCAAHSAFWIPHMASVCLLIISPWAQTSLLLLVQPMQYCSKLNFEKCVALDKGSYVIWECIRKAHILTVSQCCSAVCVFHVLIQKETTIALVTWPSWQLQGLLTKHETRKRCGKTQWMTWYLFCLFVCCVVWSTFSCVDTVILRTSDASWL